MNKQQVKIAWPFAKGEKAQLIWIGEPFRYDHKMMIKAYFRSQGRTEGILMDWGTLPCLAIQHYYTDGIITASQVPEGVQEIDITIYVISHINSSIILLYFQNISDFLIHLSETMC